MVAKPSNHPRKGYFCAYAQKVALRGFCFLVMNPIPVLVFKVFTQLESVSMRKRTQVRLKRLRKGVFVNGSLPVLRYPIFELAKYPVLCLAPHQQVVRQDHISQVINSAASNADRDFLGMQRELQPLSKKFLDWIEQVLQIFFVGRYDHEVIGVARVMFDFQFLLNELVEFVHVDVGEQLRSEVANRQTKMIKKRLPSSREAPNYLLYKPHGIRICNPLFENGQ